MLIVNTNNQILLDGKYVNLYVRQERHGTVVNRMLPYTEIEMPQKRYSLASNSFACGAGKEQFEADIREMLGKL